MIGMFVIPLVLSQHANHSEIRVLKVLILLVLIVTHWEQALLDVKLV